MFPGKRTKFYEQPMDFGCSWNDFETFLKWTNTNTNHFSVNLNPLLFSFYIWLQDFEPEP